MSSTNRMMLNRRRRVAPLVAQLEGRALLSGSHVSHAVAAHPHVEVAKKAAHVEEAKTSAVATPSPSKPKHATAKHSEAKPAARTKVAASKTQLHPDLILSPLVHNQPYLQLTPYAGTYTPAQLETAYNVNGLGLSNEGQGQTIGIVDAYADSAIVGDVQIFSSEYSLPIFNTTGAPTFSVVNEGTVPASATNGGSRDTSGETSLDVEMAHAMAPMANIVLVQVTSTSSAALFGGVDQAAALGASVVSLSYGGGESASETTTDASYFAPGTAASKVAVTVSSGDSSPTEYPSTSPNVIAVGGTGLHLANAKGKYSYETAWGGVQGDGAAGGGTSSVFATPTFQSNNGVNFGKRSVPDVSLDADPITAVSVYDSYDGQGWTAYGGTSVAAPLFAGVLALAQQDAVAAGDLPLTSVQIDTAMYAAYNSSSYSTYFHDVTIGADNDYNSAGSLLYTGHAAGTGYDQATGLGSPIASTLVPYLAKQATPKS